MFSKYTLFYEISCECFEGRKIYYSLHKQRSNIFSSTHVPPYHKIPQYPFSKLSLQQIIF